MRCAKPDSQAGCRSASEALVWDSKTGRSELSRGQEVAPFAQKRYNKNTEQKSGRFDRFQLFSSRKKVRTSSYKQLHQYKFIFARAHM